MNIKALLYVMCLADRNERALRWMDAHDVIDISRVVVDALHNAFDSAREDNNEKTVILLGIQS